MNFAELGNFVLSVIPFLVAYVMISNTIDYYSACQVINQYRSKHSPQVKAMWLKIIGQVLWTLVVVSVITMVCLLIRF